MSFRGLVEGTLAEENEYSFLRKQGFKKSGTLTDGGVVHTHPEHGAVIINKHGEWHHVPHGSSREDGFEGTTGNTLRNHISRLNESDLEEGDITNYSKYHNSVKGTGKAKWRSTDFARHHATDDAGVNVGQHSTDGEHIGAVTPKSAGKTDALALRSKMNSLKDTPTQKKWAVKQTAGSLAKIKKPMLPEGLEDTPSNFRKLVEAQLNESDLEEGDVNYAKMHTQANPKYASGTKWRKSSAAVKAKPDDVGAGELGTHGGESGHVSVKATMNQRDKLADRQEINARGHKTFAIKQTRLPRMAVRKPLPEGLDGMSGKFRELVEAQLNEISRSLATSYISGAKYDERKDRSAGVKLAQKKKWGDKKFGFEEPKVKATSEEVVSESFASHYHSLAADAIDNATGFSPRHEEYHKWMTVHHKAMRAHYEQVGDRRLADSHDAVAEHHADHVADDDFHGGESHHWSGF